MFARLSSLVLLAAVAACGPAPEASADYATSEAGVSTSSSAYVTVRADLYRRCAAPLCGGYFVKNVNSSREEQYVSHLDFSESGLDEATQEIVRATPPQELILRGRLGRLDREFRTRPLVVEEAYRGMPGISRAAGDGFYGVTDLGIMCITAPCPSLQAHKLGTSSRKKFSSLDLDAAAATRVDTAWLANRVVNGGALVAASLEAGAELPGGREQVLVASQVFLRVPENDLSCPVVRLRPCPDGAVQTWVRNADRCVLPAECNPDPMYCTLMVPSCDEGYSLRSWTGANGCTAYACDPAWVVGEEY